MESLLVLLIISVILLAFAFGWESYKNSLLIKQVQSVAHVYEMISEMYTSLAETVMLHEGIDITPYIEAITEGGNMNGKHL
jgi:type II secretory pathway pseudopilin PulG